MIDRLSKNAKRDSEAPEAGDSLSPLEESLSTSFGEPDSNSGDNSYGRRDNFEKVEATSVMPKTESSELEAADDDHGAKLEASRLAINAATQLGDWECASSELEVARSLLQRGAKPLDWDVATLYISVMSALSVAQESQRLLEVFSYMESDSVDPNGTGYGLAISAASHLAKQLEGDDPDALREALRLLSEAHELRDDLFPSPVDSRAYLAVMDACCRADYLSGAVRAFSLASEADVADERAFEYVITASANAQRPEEARQYLKNMMMKKIKPSLECFNTVISAYERSKRLREALPLLEEMRIQGDSPSL